MIFTKLLYSIVRPKNRWLTSTAIAILALFAVNSPALADSPGEILHQQSPIARVQSSKIPPKVYLYGEVDRPDVIGKEYIIFEAIGKKTIGAFYLPQSEFSCFYGEFKESKLKVTLIDSYDRQKYKYSLTLNQGGLTASKQPMMGTPAYQPLPKISDNDRRILDSCKVQLQGQQ
jgi:hypothetical protein